MIVVEVDVAVVIADMVAVAMCVAVIARCGSYVFCCNFTGFYLSRDAACLYGIKNLIYGII